MAAALNIIALALHRSEQIMAVGRRGAAVGMGSCMSDAP